jgi:hypothetical protein
VHRQKPWPGNRPLFHAKSRDRASSENHRGTTVKNALRAKASYVHLSAVRVMRVTPQTRTPPMLKGGRRGSVAPGHRTDSCDTVAAAPVARSARPLPISACTQGMKPAESARGCFGRNPGAGSRSCSN